MKKSQDPLLNIWGRVFTEDPSYFEGHFYDNELGFVLSTDGWRRTSPFGGIVHVPLVIDDLGLLRGYIWELANNQQLAFDIDYKKIPVVKGNEGHTYSGVLVDPFECALCASGDSDMIGYLEKISNKVILFDDLVEGTAIVFPDFPENTGRLVHYKGSYGVYLYGKFFTLMA